MIKYLVVSLLFDFSTMSPMWADVSLEQTGELRRQLQSANTPEKFSKGTKAYAALMHLGEKGFEILAGSWVYDKIPEENWLQWDTDFMTRYGKGTNNEIASAYANYLVQKFEKDDEFAKAAAKRLLEIKFYDDQVLLDWLKGATGSRRVGYMALRQKYSDIPVFNYKAEDVERTKQLQTIKAFLETKGSKSSHP